MKKVKIKLSGKEVRGPDRCCRKMYREKHGVETLNSNGDALV